LNGISGDQRFFLAYAYAWQGKRREEAARQQLLSEPHSPDKCRGLARLDLARVHHQHLVDRLERSGVLSCLELGSHRRHRRKAIGQHPPRTAARRDMRQRV
jgi:hypothetical protein